MDLPMHVGETDGLIQLRRARYYITSVQRLLTVEEMLNLQGLPLSYRKVARREGVSDRQLGMMVGNAIATNVLRAILPRMLTKIGKQ